MLRLVRRPAPVRAVQSLAELQRASRRGSVHGSMIPAVVFTDLLTYMDKAGFVLAFHGGRDIDVVCGMEDLVWLPVATSK